MGFRVSRYYFLNESLEHLVGFVLLFRFEAIEWSSSVCFCDRLVVGQLPFFLRLFCGCVLSVWGVMSCNLVQILFGCRLLYPGLRPFAASRGLRNLMWYDLVFIHETYNSSRSSANGRVMNSKMKVGRPLIRSITEIYRG